MISLPTVTLAIIDTRAYSLAIKTLEYQTTQCNFGDVVILTDKDIEHVNIRTHRIKTITNADQYNQAVVLSLPNAINTEHVLLCQCDGYMTNVDKWNPEWLQYDYIGAPWWYYPFNTVYPHPHSTPDTCVGNGGFSLRSKKLIDAVKILSTHYHMSKWSPEDLFICRTLRSGLEEMGCVWAPEYEAWNFSCEDTIYDNQFGFHGHNTRQLNPDIPWIVKDCQECSNKPEEYCTTCGRGGIAARDINA